MPHAADLCTNARRRRTVSHRQPRFSPTSQSKPRAYPRSEIRRQTTASAPAPPISRQSRHLRASLPTQDTPQRLVDGESLDQSGSGGNAQHRLGDEGPGKGAPILGRAAGAARRLGNEGFEADHVEGRDETPKRFGHWVDFLAQPRKQSALDMVPAGFHGSSLFRVGNWGVTVVHRSISEPLMAIASGFAANSVSVEQGGPRRRSAESNAIEM